MPTASVVLVRDSQTNQVRSVTDGRPVSFSEVLEPLLIRQNAAPSSELRLGSFQIFPQNLAIENSAQKPCFDESQVTYELGRKQEVI